MKEMHFSVFGTDGVSVPEDQNPKKKPPGCLVPRTQQRLLSLRSERLLRTSAGESFGVE